ncbi:MAG: FixH family protein [Novipirellula sp. JB048]
MTKHTSAAADSSSAADAPFEFDRIANRNAALRWGGFVVGMLSLQIAIGVIAVMLATGDPSVAVVPDYYQKSLAWDAQRESENASRQLGWTLTLVPIADPDGASLRAFLKDAEGEPVAIRSGTLRLFHHARGGDIQTVSLSPNAEGLIVLDGCFAVDGLWQVEIEVLSDQDERFIDSQDMFVNQTQRSLPRGN